MCERESSETENMSGGRPKMIGERELELGLVALNARAEALWVRGV